MVATADLNQALPPAEAQRLCDDAAAAYQRCKGLVPHGWLVVLKQDKDLSASFSWHLAQQMRRSPARWQAAIMQEGMADLMRHIQRAPQRRGQVQNCEACGMASPELKRCSACHRAGYCSRQCQVQHWPAHKAACKAARRAAAA